MNLYLAARLLWLADAVLALAAVGLGVLLVAQPVDSNPLAGGGALPATVPADPASAPRPLDYYAVCWQRDLRRPVFDTPARTGPKPQLAARLIGTILEEGFTKGMFADAKGQTVLCGVGDTVEGAQVKAIADGAVTVEFAGQTLTLKVEDKEAKP